VATVETGFDRGGEKESGSGMVVNGRCRMTTFFGITRYISGILEFDKYDEQCLSVLNLEP
jgi:hypothetical protein